MATKTYAFVVEGTAHDGQTWRTESQVTIDVAEHGFDDMVAIGMRLSFDKLTGGKAVYGKPGVGCRGPYEIDKITIERKL